MKGYYRGYYIYYLVIFSFMLNILTPAFVQAQTPYDNLNLSPEVTEGLYTDQIGEMSASQDLSEPIAPNPVIITTSGGDIYLLQGDGVKAKLHIDDKGTLEVTYTLDGSNVLMKNEFGEELTYEYLLDGQVVNLVNSAGEIVKTEQYDLGNLMSIQSQGTITYNYSDEDVLLSSVDQWGNTTMYDRGKPTQIIDNEGNIVGTYEFSGDKITSFTDNFGNSTYFDNEGIRPVYTTNDANTVTQVYEYDTDGHLVSVINKVNEQITSVDEGYYTAVYNDVGAVVSVYNYDVKGNVASVTEFGDLGVVTGWTDYDDFGRAIAAYNSEGSMTQSFSYNEKGFLFQTQSLGAIDPVSGQQSVTSITDYDKKGRASIVWQVGEGGMVKSQEHVYKSNGLLDYTQSFGVERDDMGNAVMENGDFSYILTGITTYDGIARPDAVFSLVYNEAGQAIDKEGNVIDLSSGTEQFMEMQQKYVYNRNGFLGETRNYGFNNTFTGRVVYDVYSRPTLAYNERGQETQMYAYTSGQGAGYDGFLSQTVNYGENNTITGWTNYDNKGKPSEGYNHAGSLLQSFVYDSSGLLVRSISYGRGSEDFNEIMAATVGDYSAIAALWQDAWDSDPDMAFVFGDMDGETLMNAGWAYFNNGDMETAKACFLKTIQLYGGLAEGEPALENHVGTAYHMIGQIMESEGQANLAQSAYTIQAADYADAVALAADGVTWESVTDWSVSRLQDMGATSSMATGFTVYGGDSRPMATYQYYNDGENGLQATKVQEYNYSYTQTYRDENGQTQERTQYSSFVRGTSNFGDNGVNNGFTDFDNYGRQNASYNEEGEMVQKYNYSRNGFLQYTTSYGRDKAVNGYTVFDFYGRHVASFNNAGSVRGISSAAIAELSHGLVSGENADGETEVLSESWQPHLKGLTQTFEYGDDGFMNTSKSWSEATEVSVNTLSSFIKAMGPEGSSTERDGYYRAEYDFNDDGMINNEDLQLFEEAFSGISELAAAFDTVQGDAGYNSSFDFDSDGDVDRNDVSLFGRTFDSSTKFTPTYNGFTEYDSYGKASAAFNKEGIATQDFVYNSRGFMTEARSFGPAFDPDGNMVMDGEQPAMIQTGSTRYDERSKPVETWSCYDADGSGTIEEGEMAKVQEYVYDRGFLTQTNNFGDFDADGVQVSAGYTTFDKLGRQETSFNELGEKTAQYRYSRQGFLQETFNYGQSGTYTGKTIMNKEGRASASYNMAGDVLTGRGLTQTFNYNQFGFMDSSVGYGREQTENQTTFYDGAGKALRVENHNGITVSAYDYNQRGFMEKTTALEFVQDDSASGEWAVDVTNKNTGETRHGYYKISSYTTFDAYSRPEESYQCYWDTPDGEGALVQRYNYETEDGQQTGFLVSVTNFGTDGVTEIGKTTFDRYGRNESSFNEYGQQTASYKYSRDGFLDETYGYNAGTKASTTVFDNYGRQIETRNHRGAVTQTYNYTEASGSEFTGKLLTSTSRAEDGVETGTTIYDEFGKSMVSLNVEGSVVQQYNYNQETGWMENSESIGRNGVVTGRTTYDVASRPTESTSLYVNMDNANPQEMETISQKYVYEQGFLVRIENFGDLEDASNPQSGVAMGHTEFDRYGQQEASYNELGELTTRFTYSRQGFLSETRNYGVDNTYMGKTTFNAMQRMEASYNERNQITQRMNYDSAGFLSTSSQFGEAGEAKVLGTTHYDDYGKQSHVTNDKGLITTGFVYNDRGFLQQTQGLGLVEGTGGTPGVDGYIEFTNTETGELTSGWLRVTSYNNFDKHGRMTNSYSVYDSDLNTGEGERAVLTSEFVYDKADGTKTGFVTGIKTYSLVTDVANGVQTIAAEADGNFIADTIGTEVIQTGYVDYDRYGRAAQTYQINYNMVDNADGTQGVGTMMLDENNDPLMTIVSENRYSRNGFLESTRNYGDNRTINGTVFYNDMGQQDYSVNQRNELTSDFHYDDLGRLQCSISYQGEGNALSRTEFDPVYQKPTTTWQFFSGSNPPEGSDYNSVRNKDGYASDPNGTVRNYNPNDLTEAGTGCMVQQTYYNDFGSISSQNSLTRSGELNSFTLYNTLSRPTAAYRLGDDGSMVKVQSYAYNERGFLDHSTQHQAYDSLEGTWDESDVSITYYNALGQQYETYNVADDGSQGALQALYKYDRSGFLNQISHYNDKGKRTGYTTVDLTGHNVAHYNSKNVLDSFYWYNRDGFLATSTSHAPGI